LVTILRENSLFGLKNTFPLQNRSSLSGPKPKFGSFLGLKC
jgi:hypothetical protein